MPNLSFLKDDGLLFIIASFTYFVFVVDRKLRERSTRLPLPPGPKRIPIIGNLLNAPTGSEIHKVYRDWSLQHGSDIVYLDLPSQPMLILNSAKASFDLLEKRSDIYSDRPHSTIDELLGTDYNVAFMRYSLKWRNHRRLFHQFFNCQVTPNYSSEQVKATHMFLRRSLQPCDNLADSVRLTLGSTILGLVYGIDVDDMNHPYIQDVRAEVECINQAHVAGNFWIDYFPFLRNVPGWLPGIRFKRFVEKNQALVDRMKRKPFDDIRIAAESSTVPPSITYTLLGKLQARIEEVPLEEYLQEEETVINVTGIAYAAGTETTASNVLTFFLMLAERPDIQRKAQSELDTYLGNSRLVDSSDYGALPFIAAIALEVMRYRPSLPLGVPYRVMEDDEYNGFFIPKGTTVVSNFWATLHDANDYPDPECFNPERFLKDGKLDPTVRNPNKLAFGFGRRICPGRHFGNMSIFLIIASVLQVFDIEPAKDANGVGIALNSIKYTAGLVASPESLPCVLRTRSEAARSLVLQSM
ncbi:cytochrome P450 [Abortiporus biennis]|nr:cytochrome P450 [Abortiporus biennis]